MSKEKFDEDVAPPGSKDSPPNYATQSSEEDVELAGGQQPLKRALESRHMQMIAICGSIGAGLFVGSGGALASGGPGSLVIDFIITGFMLLLTVNALGELAGEHTS